MADGIKARIAGVWKDLTPSIRVGGVWKTPDKVHIRVGGVWKEVWANGGPAVTLSTNVVVYDYSYGSSASAAVEVYRNGNIDETPGVGAANEWVLDTDQDTTLGDSYEVKLDKTSGSTPTGPSLGIWYTISTTRTWTLTGYLATRTFGGTLTIREIADTSNTGSCSVSLTAESESGGGCPLCCFTPDTLVSMARGIDVPIASVRDGDEIMTPSGPKTVEVITRFDVPVFTLSFEDGRRLELTPDHPLQTERGPASLSQHDYKDIGVPEKLQVGDRVFTDDGGWVRLVGISKARKEPVVHTFNHSLFYANGILVY